MKTYLKLMRVHHYIKNLLVFVALACSGQFFSTIKIKNGLEGFLSFCFLSSFVYIINDLKDYEKDKLHPTKCKRPIAAGLISKKVALCLAAILLIMGIVMSYFIHKPFSIIYLLIYIAFNIGYSFGLKNIPILDIFILVSGFLIRILYGAYITDIVVSDWLYLTVITISMFFSLGKRRNEQNRSIHETRTVLKYYPKNFLDKTMYLCLCLANAFYALWTIEKKTYIKNGKILIWTVPLVLFISLTYCMNIEGDSEGDPVEVILNDKLLLVLCSAYIIVMAFVFYS